VKHLCLLVCFLVCCSCAWAQTSVDVVSVDPVPAGSVNPVPKAQESSLTDNEISDAKAGQSSSDSESVAVLSEDDLIPLDLDSENETDTVRKEPSLSSGENLARLALKSGVSLLVVLGLAVGALFGIRRWMGLSKTHANGTHIRVLQRVGLNAKHTIYLLDIGAQLLVVGGTPDRLDSLAEINDPEEVARLRGTDQSDGPFTEQLNAAGQAYEPLYAASGVVEPDVEDMDRLKSEVGKIRTFVTELRNRTSGH